MKSFNKYALSKHAAEQHHGLSHKFAAWVQVGGNRFYYMASSVSGEGKSNPAPWLATRFKWSSFSF